MTGIHLYDAVDMAISDYAERKNVRTMPLHIAAVRHVCSELETECGIEIEDDVRSFTASVDEETGVLSLSVVADAEIVVRSDGECDVLKYCSAFAISGIPDGVVLTLRFDGIFDM